MPEEEHLKRTEAEMASTSEDAAACSDNRNLTDNRLHQKLSSDEIKELRADGASGQEIIKALVDNSETWKSKTVFSQQKWLARKEQKYAPRVRLVRCDALEVCESYFQKHREKVSSLRPDSLAQILAFANIYAAPHFRALVFDTVSGVVVTACAERLGGHGRVLAAYGGTHPSMDGERPQTIQLF